MDQQRLKRTMVFAAAAGCLALVVGCARPLEEVVQTAPPKPDGPVVMRTAAVLSATDPAEAGHTAALALQQAMGDAPVAAVLLSENFEDAKDKQQVVDAVCSVFSEERVFGLATYGSFAQTGCSQGDSVALVGIGGAGVSVAAALERDFGVSGLSMETDEAEIAQRLRVAGAALASKLPRQAKDKLLVLLADAHSPKNQHFVEGVQIVLGKDFPIVGGCANKNAGQTFVYFGGRKFPDSGVALLLAGDFQVGLAGRKAQDNDRVVATAREAAKEAAGKAGGKPFAAFAFNCAGRKGKLRRIEDELEAIQAALGKDVPLFGCYCAGEMGIVDAAERTAGTLCGGSGWHVMFAVLAR